MDVGSGGIVIIVGSDRLFVVVYCCCRCLVATQLNKRRMRSWEKCGEKAKEREVYLRGKLYNDRQRERGGEGMHVSSSYRYPYPTLTLIIRIPLLYSCPTPTLTSTPTPTTIPIHIPMLPIPSPFSPTRVIALCRLPRFHQISGEISSLSRQAQLVASGGTVQAVLPGRVLPGRTGTMAYYAYLALQYLSFVAKTSAFTHITSYTIQIAYIPRGWQSLNGGNHACIPANMCLRRIVQIVYFE